MESHGHISLHAKQICSNCFMFPVLERVLVVLDLGLNKDASDGNDVDAAAASTPGLSTSFFFFSLLIVSQKPENNSRCDDAYRRLFFYYRLAHGPVYTCGTDDRFVIVFYPSSVKLDASSARMSLLQIKHFPTLWFTDKQFFKFLHKYLVVDLNE